MRRLFGPAFVFAGIMHFVIRRAYEPGGRAALIARPPLQAVFIAWARAVAS